MFRDSRYNKEKSVDTVFRGGIRRQITFRDINRGVPTGSRQYTIKATDTLDSLAYTHLGNGEFWWAIADLNPHIEPWDLSKYVGTQIWIPPKNKALGRIKISQRATFNLNDLTPSAYVIGEVSG